MDAYTGTLEMRDDLAPVIIANHLGQKRKFLTHGKEEWSRAGFVDGLFLHVLTFDPDDGRYILETLEPQGSGARRVEAFATVAELKALNGGNDPADNEAIVTLMVPQLAYDADAFADVHAEAQARAEARMTDVTPTEDEVTLFASMKNSHRLNAAQRKTIRDELIPAMKKRGDFPAAAPSES